MIIKIKKNKMILQKILLFICLFSYIFSETTFTAIQPTSATLGETIDFNITVENYESSVDIKIGENDWSYYFYMPYCNLEGTNNVICRTKITFNDKKQLNNLEKILYKNYAQTSLKININLPTSLKLVFFNEYKFYSYGLSKLVFETNYNKLLFSTSPSIKIGSISITNCAIDQNSITNIECEHKFTQNNNGENLILSFNGQTTDNKITIATPPEFSNVKYLKKDTYYVSSSSQDIYFEVDSSYKMSSHSIVLIPLTSTNPSITLSSCTYFGYGIYSAKCSAVLDKNEVYNIYVDNKKISDKLTVNPTPSAISKVFNIKPNEYTISSNDATFTLQVDYVTNLGSTTFTLKDYYNSANEVKLKSCAKVEGTTITNEITCVGKITNAGYYNLYLNGVKQNEIRIRAHNSQLTKAIKVEKNIIKFTSSSTEEIVNIVIDSIGGDLYNVITLKSDSNTAEREYFAKDLLMMVAYKVKFPAAGTYYVYVNDVKQDNAYVIVTNDALTSSVSSISPSSVLIDNDITFTLTVDTNYGIASSKIYLKKDADYSALLNCEPVSSDTTKATCVGHIYPNGEYYVVINGNEFKNVKVTANAASLQNCSPNSFSISSNLQSFTLNFDNDVSKFVDSLYFMSDEEIIEPTCKSSSANALTCSAVFETKGKYSARLNGIDYESYVDVTESNNINNGYNNINDNHGSYINKIKYISLLLLFITLI